MRALVSLYQIPRKGVILLLGSITLILPTVLMKPSSYLKVTANISLIITLAHPENRRGSSYYQPIMRTEDRLFDRGWVRSAMATRKCGNIYFSKYFMAVRPFFTRNFVQGLFGLEGSKNLLENFVRCTI